MNSYIRFIVPVLAVALTACGTTSDIKPDSAPVAEGGAPTQNVKLTVDLSAYDKVVVLDFADATDTSKLKPDQLRSHNEMMATDLPFLRSHCARIRDRSLLGGGTRARGQGTGHLRAGHAWSKATARFVCIGMGRGVLFRRRGQVDGFETGNTGQCHDRQQQLALGGALASGQTVQSFRIVSSKIATRLRDGKKSQSSAGVPHASTGFPKRLGATRFGRD